MNVLEVARGDHTRVVRQTVKGIVLFELNLVAIDRSNPCHMTISASIGLSDGARLGGIVDGEARSLRGIVPLVGIAPDAALIATIETAVEMLGNAPSDEAHALA